VKIQERLNISPYVFQGFADTFWSDLYVQGHPCDFLGQHDSRNPLLPETTPIYSQLRINNKEIAFITAVATLPGKSRLILDCSDADWPAIQPWWERFRSELKEEELLDVAKSPGGALDPELTPQERYNHIIMQARERAAANGLLAKDLPEHLTGAIEIPEWFLAFWYPRDRTLEDYAAKFTQVGKRQIERHWETYRAMHDIPKLRELDKLRQGKTPED